ncbi:MAG: IclR family transcriptional regulator, partial [Desulfobacula sp.]|nr:IclR family transcriptional regulator [Desulfobacula sp.]
EIGIHKSKGFSILNSLAQYDLITKDGKTKTYSLGPALMPLARKAREKLDINAIAKDHLQKLANETKASVLLGIICNDQFYIAGKYDGNEKLSVTVRQYQSLHITHGSHGKAIFAFLNDKDRQRIINSDQLFFHGDIESLDKKRLEQELKFCRENGYAVDNGEITPGITAVSSPVFDHNNEVTAAIVLVGTFKEDKFETFGKKIAATGRIISKQAGAQLP